MLPTIIIFRDDNFAQYLVELQESGCGCLVS